ncbi:VOC family protein [Virgibacillus doumboii]|uniref:VOC family protein n=1 Tax=Virgibacillus doumboii TaxID=2697503 RepID=UPI0013E0A3E6|nr:VOC family protein [Virgibacillus doumboii]
MNILKVYTPIFIQNDQLEESIAFYEELLGERSGLRFLFRAGGLEIATVGSILLVAGSEDAIAPVKEMKLALLVDSLHEWKEELIKKGVTILSEPQEVPTGYNMFVRHTDGSLVEYIEWVNEKVDAINLIKNKRDIK